MPEWPEGIPNPHPHDPRDEADHEDHHRAEEALLAYIHRRESEWELQSRVSADAQMQAQALLAVRDAAQKFLATWKAATDPDVTIEMKERWAVGVQNIDAAAKLKEALQGLPEHLKGQA